jgi:prophage antirepressor-like protein
VRHEQGAAGRQDVGVAGTWDRPLFCLADVCRLLGISDPSNWAKALDGQELHACPVSDTGQVRKTTFVTGGGLYTILFRSDKPSPGRSASG